MEHSGKTLVPVGKRSTICAFPESLCGRVLMLTAPTHCFLKFHEAASQHVASSTPKRATYRAKFTKQTFVDRSEASQLSYIANGKSWNYRNG